MLNSDCVPHNPEICTKYSSFITAFYIYVSCAGICFSCEVCNKVPDLSKEFIKNFVVFPGDRGLYVVDLFSCFFLFHFLPYFLQEIYRVRVGFMEVTFGIFQCGSVAWDCFTSLSLTQKHTHTHTHTHTQSCRDLAHYSEKLVTSVKSAAEQPGFLCNILI